MSSRNVETLRAAYESWNRREFDRTVEHTTDNVVYQDHGRNETLHGKQKFLEYVRSWAQVMPDGKITNTRFIDAGDVVIAEFTGEGTNNGSFAGLPPTGRHVSLAFCDIWHFDKNGRMTSCSCYYDLYGMLVQMGHLKPVAIAA